MLDTWNNLIKDLEAERHEIAGLRVMADCAYMFSASQKEEADAFDRICFRLARVIIKMMNVVANATGYITPTPKATAKAMTIDPYYEYMNDWELWGNDPVRVIRICLNTRAIIQTEPERLLDIMAGLILASVFPDNDRISIRSMATLLNHGLGLDIRFVQTGYNTIVA